MSVEENKALVRCLLDEIWNKVNPSVVERLCSVNFTFNYAALSGVSNDLEGYKQMVTIWHSGVSGIRLTLEDVIAEGNKVAVHWEASCTHTGEFLGVPPTGKKLTMVGISIFYTKDGKIIREWGEMDVTGLMQQLRSE
jgi:predicted ester cyclase